MVLGAHILGQQNLILRCNRLFVDNALHCPDLFRAQRSLLLDGQHNPLYLRSAKRR